ncbi:MAG: hypothetical protein IPJ04_05275 [Candidatus Eisenbacteria bacterium]|nr:hypothetical protein [Candidatus Eisenbacteria bacterium]
MIWNNNMIVLLDTTPSRGLQSMLSINSWRRYFTFDTTGSTQGTGFAPDLFCATWDGNTSPRLIVQVDGNTVLDQVVGPAFRASASFSQGNLGRSMEFAIPWQQVFLSAAGLGTQGYAHHGGRIRTRCTSSRAARSSRSRASSRPAETTPAARTSRPTTSAA